MIQCLLHPAHFPNKHHKMPEECQITAGPYNILSNIDVHTSLLDCGIAQNDPVATHQYSSTLQLKKMLNSKGLPRYSPRDAQTQQVPYDARNLDQDIISFKFTNLENQQETIWLSNDPINHQRAITVVSQSAYQKGEDDGLMPGFGNSERSAPPHQVQIDIENTQNSIRHWMRYRDEVYQMKVKMCILLVATICGFAMFFIVYFTLTSYVETDGVSSWP